MYCGCASTWSLTRRALDAPSCGETSAARPTWNAYTVAAETLPALSFACTLSVRWPSAEGVIDTVVAPVAATVTGAAPSSEYTNPPRSVVPDAGVKENRPAW